MTPMPAIIRAMAAFAALSTTTISAIAADTFRCTFESGSSTVTQSNTVVAPLAGDLIGDYDATTNPTGTLTIPGLFGGSGNNPIPYSASFVLDGDTVSAPTGAFDMTLDLATGVATIEGLALDLLGGVPASLGATFNVNYASFHTLNPTSVFPGGVEIPIPVGEGVVSELRAEQTGAATGGIVPAKGGYTFVVPVPVNLVTSATVLDTTVADGVATPSVIPLSGTVVISGDSIAVTASFKGQSSETQPVDQAFDPVAFELPTVLPAGGIANVLVSGTVTEISTENVIAANLVATGARVGDPADLNGDGLVDAMDLAIQLGNWGGSGIGDLNDDGLVDAMDLSILLGAWT